MEGCLSDEKETKEIIKKYDSKYLERKELHVFLTFGRLTFRYPFQQHRR